MATAKKPKPCSTPPHGFVPGTICITPNSPDQREVDGRWVFGNGTIPRVARIDLSTFRTTEIIELPNSAGNHLALATENTEYVVAGTRFSVPPTT